MNTLKQKFKSISKGLSKIFSFIIGFFSVSFYLLMIVIVVMTFVYGINVKFGNESDPIISFYINKNGDSTKKLLKLIKGDKLDYEKIEVTNDSIN